MGCKTFPDCHPPALNVILFKRSSKWKLKRLGQQLLAGGLVGPIAKQRGVNSYSLPTISVGTSHCLRNYRFCRNLSIIRLRWWSLSPAGMSLGLLILNRIYMFTHFVQETFKLCKNEDLKSKIYYIWPHYFQGKSCFLFECTKLLEKHC